MVLIDLSKIEKVIKDIAISAAMNIGQNAFIARQDVVIRVARVMAPPEPSSRLKEPDNAYKKLNNPL